MAKTKEEILLDIGNYIIKHSSDDDNEWYIGITKDIKERLFTFHNVNKENGRWIYRPASSSKIAREIEKKFLDLGCDGGTGGGDDDSDIVYAYKITDYTIER